MSHLESSLRSASPPPCCAWGPSPTAWGRIAAALALGLCIATSGQAAPAQTTKAFCEAHPTLDAPKPGGRPKDIAAIEGMSVHWRCMEGRAFVCDGGAADSGCRTMVPARTPSADIRDFCDDNPGTAFVPMAMLGNSATTWRCAGKTPTIIATQPLDARGFMKAMWIPLTLENGEANRHIDLPADPR